MLRLPFLFLPALPIGGVWFQWREVESQELCACFKRSVCGRLSSRNGQHPQSRIVRGEYPAVNLDEAFMTAATQG
eukprot:1200912-Amphidinium_carterae.1